MDLRERIPIDNNGEISIINRNLSEIIKNERDGLVKIFECKENIDSAIEKIFNLKDATQSELLDNLMASKKDLFKRFFINYCKSKKLLKYSDNYSDDLEKYVEIEDVVRYNLGVKIFNNVKKDDILNVVDNPLDYKDIYLFIDDFVSSFVDHIKSSFSKKLFGYKEDVGFNNFVDHFKNTVSELIKLKISDNTEHMDVYDLFDLISEILYASTSADSLEEIFDDYSKNGAICDKSCLCVEDLVHGTCIKDFNFEKDLDLSAINRENIVADTWNFIQIYLNSDGEFDLSDRDALINKIYGIYLDDEYYEKWKRIFISRVKLPVKSVDLKLNNIDDSENIQAYISELVKKYPKAKKHLGHIGRQRLNEMKVMFLKEYEDILIKKLSLLLDNETLKNLNLVQLFNVMYFYLFALNSDKLDLSNDFERYIMDFLEKRFAESDKKVAERELSKKSVDESVHTTQETLSSDKLKPSLYSFVSRKKELNEDLVEDMNFYFTHVDTTFSEEKKRETFRALKKLPGKIYKRSWFKKYDLSDIFFEILDKHGYECEDEELVVENSVDENTVVEINACEINDGIVSDSIDPLVFDLYDEIQKIGDISQKIDKYCEILKLLGYSFYKKEHKFSEHLLALCKSNGMFFTSFENMIFNLIFGNQVVEKKAKKYQNMPVYSIDIGRTGYRLISFSMGDTNEKFIYDIVSHNDYITFLDKKCNG